MAELLTSSPYPDIPGHFNGGQKPIGVPTIVIARSGVDLPRYCRVIHHLGTPLSDINVVYDILGNTRTIGMVCRTSSIKDRTLERGFFKS